jgi:hypothetical protein
MHGPFHHVTCSNRKVNGKRCKVDIRFLTTSPHHACTTSPLATLLYHDNNYYNHHNHHGNDNNEGSDKGDKGIGQGFESQMRLEPQVCFFFLFSYLSLIYIIYRLQSLCVTTLQYILKATSADHFTSREWQRGTGGLRKTAMTKKALRLGEFLSFFFVFLNID